MSAPETGSGMTAKLAALKALAVGDTEETFVPVKFGDWWHRREDPQVRLLRAEVRVKEAEIRFLKAENAVLEARVLELGKKTQAPQETEQQVEARRRAETAAINAKWAEQQKRDRENPDTSYRDPREPQYKN
jgi:hypothetical protein